MNLKNHLNSILSLFRIGNSVFVNNGEFLSNGKRNERIDTPNSFRYNSTYVSVISNGEFRIYDEQLNLLRTLADKVASPGNSGIDVFDLNCCVTYNTTDTTSATVFLNGKEVSQTRNFSGKMLNASYRLNFDAMPLGSITQFRCSDLLDHYTFFTYRCEPGEEIINSFYVWNDRLIFPTEKRNQLHLTVLDLKTGDIVWNPEIEYSFFMFDGKNNQMVSVWGNDGVYPDRPRKYQVIKLQEQQVDIGIPDGAGPLYNAHTYRHLQLLYGRKMYFPDNRRSFAGQTPSPVRVGRFDIPTRTVDLLLEISESPLYPISEIVESDESLYLRNSNNELLIYNLDK